MTYGEVIIACFHLITGVCVRATEKAHPYEGWSRNNLSVAVSFILNIMMKRKSMHVRLYFGLRKHKVNSLYVAKATHFRNSGPVVILLINLKYILYLP